METKYINKESRIMNIKIVDESDTVALFQDNKIIGESDLVCIKKDNVIELRNVLNEYIKENNLEENPDNESENDKKIEKLI